MDLETRVPMAQTNKSLRDDIILEYTNFVLACASKTLGRHITPDDDVFSVAIIAFDEAITNYNADKGLFLSFAGRIIKNRIIDHERRETKHRSNLPFSSLSQDDGEGEEFTFDTEDRRHSLTDAALEIRFLAHELAKYSISLEDMGRSAPKFASTKAECMRVIKHIANSSELTEIIKQKKALPAKRLIKELDTGEKLLERHRKYIIAAVIILTGEYESIAKML